MSKSEVEFGDSSSTVNILHGSSAIAGTDAQHGASAAPAPLKLANPAPIGLVAFGITTIMLNFLNAGITESPAAVLVMSYGIFHGGFIQLVAGAFEIVKGNTFGATAFVSYGGFWMGLALFDLLVLTNTLAKAVWLCCWGVFTTGMFLCTFRTNRATQFVFGSLAVLFFLLAGGEFSPLVKTIAGYEGIVCGLSAVLTGLAEVANETYGEVVPLGKIKQH